MGSRRNFLGEHSSVSFLLTAVVIAMTAFVLITFAVSDDSDAAVTDFDVGDYHYTVLSTDNQVQISYLNEVEDVVIPETVTYDSITYEVKQVASGGFMNKSCIKTVTFPVDGKYMDIINTYAFYGCTNLESVTLPESLTKILEFSFSNCPSIETIWIREKVSMIGTQAFFNCASLSSISVDADNSYYTAVDGVLYDKDKTKLLTYPLGKTGDTFSMANTVETIDKYAMYYAKFKTVVMSNVLTTINESAFEGSSIRTITIPAKVASIASRAFVDCKSLESVTVNSENNNYVSDDGVLFNKTKTELILYPSCKQGDRYVIPDVLYIGDYAFDNNIYLTEVEFTSEVKTIGAYAFSDCIHLIRIDIPSSVTQMGIGAFSGCIAMKSVLLPSGTTVLEESVFRDCSALEVFYILNTVKTIRADAFTGCTSMMYLYIPSSIEYCEPSAAFGGFTFYHRNAISIVTEKDEVIGHTYYGNMKAMVQQIGTYSMIHYDENQGSVILNDEMVKHSTTYMFPKYNGTLGGYVFAGWLYQDVLYQPGDTMISPSMNTTITAQWKEVVQEDTTKKIEPNLILGIIIAVAVLLVAIFGGRFVYRHIKDKRIMQDEADEFWKRRRGV